MSEQYETRMEIMKKIHELRDLVVKMNPPNTQGHVNEIFKAIRDGHKRAEDPNYTRICFGIILNHIIHLDEKCNLTDTDLNLKLAMKRLEEQIEFYPLKESDTS